MTATRSLVMGTMFVTAGALGLAQQRPAPAAIAKALMTELAARRFDRAADRLGEPLKTRWPREKIGGAWDGILEQHGAFRRVTIVSTRERAKGGHLVQMSVVFEKATLDNSAVTVDQDGRVVDVVLAKKKAAEREPGDLVYPSTVGGPPLTDVQ